MFQTLADLDAELAKAGELVEDARAKSAVQLEVRKCPPKTQNTRAQNRKIAVFDMLLVVGGEVLDQETVL